MKVDIIIAGAEKCGTTALHHFLSKHPKVIGSEPKELHFFNVDKSVEKGIAHYHSFFSPQPRFASLRGFHFMEASPSYIADTKVPFIEQTAKRIHDYNTKAKIIILVRDPADRAFSAWKMYKERYDAGNKDWAIKAWLDKGNVLPENFVRRTPEEFVDFDLYVRKEIEAPKKNIQVELNVLRNGHYDIGITVFRKYFGKNVIVIKNEDLNSNTPQVLEQVSDAIGLSKNDWKEFKGVKIFSGNYSEKPQESTIRILREYYKESNNQLRLLTGISYD